MYSDPEDRAAREIAAPLPEGAEEFAERAAQIVNTGSQAVMISIGHRSGLFDTLARLEPSTSARIAEEAGLVERYVREWLATLVTAGIVHYDPAARTYDLPPAHAACLTRGAPLGNLAVFGQFVALLGAVEEQTLQLLERGEGTCYGDYPCFHQIMAEDSAQSVVAPLVDDILPMVTGIERRLEEGIAVLDAGCGRGLALIEMARHFPRSRFTGYDLCADAIEEARRSAEQVGLENARFTTRDLTHFDEIEQYDFITSFDAVHDQKHPGPFIASIHRALKPAGVYLMQDIGGSAHLENNVDFPMASLLYAMSLSHCTPISIGQGGDGLGTMWGWETARDLLIDAGFAPVERRVLDHDPMNVWFISRKA